MQFLCIPGNPGRGTHHQSILKVEFQHDLGVGIRFFLLLLSGTCLAIEAGISGVCLNCNDGGS